MSPALCPARAWANGLRAVSVSPSRPTGVSSTIEMTCMVTTSPSENRKVTSVPPGSVSDSSDCDGPVRSRRSNSLIRSLRPTSSSARWIASAASP